MRVVIRHTFQAGPILDLRENKVDELVNKLDSLVAIYCYLAPGILPFSGAPAGNGLFDVR